MKKFILALVILIVSISVFGCSSTTPANSPVTANTKPNTTSSAPTVVATSTASPASGTPIKIGAIIPLTGPLQHEGPCLREGLELSLKDYGSSVAGRKVELLIEDSATDPTTALEKARKLVESDGVSIIISPQASNVAQAIQPYLLQHKIVCLKSRQFPEALMKKFPYLFAAEGTQAQVTYPMGLYAYNVLGYKTVSTGTDDYVAGRAFMAGFDQGFKDAGGTIVQEQYWPNTSVDFSSYLTNVKTADAFCAWTGGPGGAQLIKQYFSYGLNKRIPIITPYISGILNENVLPTVGDDALGIIGPEDYASSLDNPVNKRMVSEWRQTYGWKNFDSSGVMGGYVNMQIALEALKATGGNTNADNLKNAILKLTINSPAGPIHFNSDRMGSYNVYINKVAKDSSGYFWQVIKTYPDQAPR